MRYLLVAFLAVSGIAGAVVIRHDVDSAAYLASPSEFPALVDMPREAHGVLIAPQWVVTAAHTIPHGLTEVGLNGLARKVERVVIHPGYQKLPDSLVAEAIKSGDASAAMRFQARNNDIALIKLAEPALDVEPATLYQGKRELGQVAMLLGKGAFGTGKDGQDPQSAQRTVLRRAYNRITSVDETWLGYVFDQGTSALPLEGMGGGGDSGGPVLLKSRGGWQLAGLNAWKLVEGNAAAFRPGVYGQMSYAVRLSGYARWIDHVMSSGAHTGAAEG